MKILITGGAGFIGSHVCEALSEHETCIYDNFNDYYNPKFKRDNVKDFKHLIVEADIRDANALESCFVKHSFDAVIHLAASAGVRPSIENAMGYIDVNINGTMQILEAMKRHDVKKLVFASSSSVYGGNTKVPFSENDIVDRPISPYAATKKAGELLCHTYSHLYGISIACLRFFTVYGPRQRPDLAIYKFAAKMCAGETLPFYGDGTMGRDFTYIDDIVSGILLALDWVCRSDKQFEVFNLGESEPISLNDMVAALEKVFGLTAVLDRLPVPPGDVDLTWADVSKAAQILGYNPSTPFEQGLKKFADWFNANRRGGNS